MIRSSLFTQEVNVLDRMHNSVINNKLPEGYTLPYVAYNQIADLIDDARELYTTHHDTSVYYIRLTDGEFDINLYEDGREMYGCIECSGWTSYYYEPETNASGMHSLSWEYFRVYTITENGTEIDLPIDMRTLELMF